jgi:hypothetical protein
MYFPVKSFLIIVSQKDLRSGKSKSFDGKAEEWQQILLDVVFGKGNNDVQLAAQVNKSKKSDVTVLLLGSHWLTSRLLFNDLSRRTTRSLLFILYDA